MHCKKSEKFKAEKYDPDAKLRELDQELGQKLLKIRHYQKEIKELRHSLIHSYDIDKITQLEDQIKSKQSYLTNLKKEEQALERVSQEQQQALNQIYREGDYDDKIQVLEEEHKKAKQEERKMRYEQMEKGKELLEKHEKLVGMD